MKRILLIILALSFVLTPYAQKTAQRKKTATTARTVRTQKKTPKENQRQGVSPRLPHGQRRKPPIAMLPYEDCRDSVPTYKENQGAGESPPPQSGRREEASARPHGA